MVTFSSSTNDILFLPPACVVFLMSQHVADVNLVPIIVHRGDQSWSACGNVLRSCVKFRKRLFRIIAYQRARRDLASGVLFRELVQALPRNDMHCWRATLSETFFDEKPPLRFFRDGVPMGEAPKALGKLRSKNGANGRSDIEGKAVRVTASDSGSERVSIKGRRRRCLMFDVRCRRTKKDRLQL